MTPPRVALLISAAALAVVVALGLTRLASGPQAGSERLSMLTAASMTARLAGSPPPLAALHAQGGQLLDGGAAALSRRLAALKGYPVVVNKWASWCEPCRAEFPVFQHAATDMGRRVAFIGLDSGDSERSKAVAFLRYFPVPYPSFYDPSGQLGEQLTSSPFTPVTLFIAPDGSRYPHQGPYPSVQKLEGDVERYAMHA